MHEATSEVRREPGRPMLRPSVRRAIVILLLGFGLELWLTIGRGYWRRLEPRLLVVAFAVCAIPPVARRLYAVIERLRRRPRRSVALATAGLMALFAAVYLPWDAYRDGRALAPRIQDEYSYLIQAQQVARGRLWMPAHPLADFFESFQLLTRPVYASVYFPGTAMVLAPGVWLGLPTWVIPSLLAGATIGATFLVVAYLVDPVAGFVAGLVLLCLPTFRLMAIKPMSQVPEMLLSLVAIGAYLLWRERRRPSWAVVLGVALGWAAITRPIDALCVGIPVGIAMLLDLRRDARGGSMRTIALVAVGIVPFLLIQVVFDWGVTGNPLHTPYNLYVERYLPGAQYGFHPYNPAARPASGLLQQQEFYDRTRSLLAGHTPGHALRDLLFARVPLVLVDDVPHPMLLVLVPVGAAAVLRRRRWVLAATLPAYLGVYYFHVFFLTHYDLVAAAAIAMVLASAGAAVRDAFVGAVGRGAYLATCAAVVILCLSQLREFNRLVTVDPIVSAQQDRVDRALAALPGTCVVLFRYPGNQLPEQEVVYNTGVAWPDDARVIRAHDLGPGRDRELFAYYAARTPAREAYLYDRGTDSLKDLGPVERLARQ